MSFRTKYHHLCSADIIVIPECESKEKLPDEFNFKYPNSFWYGNNLNKGIGVFSSAKYKVELISSFNPALKFIIPLKVTSSNYTFNLFAIWSQVNGNYTNNLHDAISHYNELLIEDSILIGDFNSNKVWDKKSSIGNHSRTVSLLQELEIRSAYHEFFKEEQGKESQPTFFMYHHKDKPYHIDYCFLSKAFVINSLTIGKYENWKGYSDHMPYIIDLNMDDKFKFTSSEAKKLLKVSDCKLMHLREEGIIRAKKKGRAFMYHESDIVSYIDSKRD